MCMHCKKPRLLARYGSTFNIFDLRDGQVRLDMGPASIVLSRASFVGLVGILETACEQLDTSSDGLLSGNSVDGAIWRCGVHGTLALMIDRVVLRLHPDGLAILADVCYAARQILQQNTGVGDGSSPVHRYALN